MKEMNGHTRVFHAYRGREPYLFVSYAHADIGEICPFFESMEKNRYRFWYDEGIESGKDWADVISGRIANCSQFIVFISKNSANSDNVKNEINLALSRKKEIIRIQLDDTELRDGLELNLGSKQALYCSKYSAEETQRRFCAALRPDTVSSDSDSSFTAVEKPEKRGKKKPSGAIKGILAAVAVVVVIAGVVVFLRVKKADQNKVASLLYEEGIALMETGDYAGAASAFEGAGTYDGAGDKLAEARAKQEQQENYEQGVALLENGDYEGAIAAFEQAGTYDGAQEKLTEAQTQKAQKASYDEGVALLEAGNYEGAIAALEKAGTYDGAQEKLEEARTQKAQKEFYEQGLRLCAVGDYEGAIAALEQAGTYEDAADYLALAKKAQKASYDEGVALLEAGDYEGAIAALEKAGTYGGAEGKLTEARAKQEQQENYEQGVALLEAGNYEGAIAALEKAGTYDGAQEKLEEAQEKQTQKEYYEQGLRLCAAGDYEGAIAVLEKAGTYEDAADYLALAKDKAEEASRSQYTPVDKAETVTFAVGATVTFGEYEQDGNVSDGKEPIEWIVLAVKDDSAFLVSRYVLEWMQFDKSGSTVTWKSCSLCEWLNTDFYQTAFTDTERSAIQGDSKVTLLSMEEVSTYMGRDTELLIAQPTQYALDNGAKTWDKGGCWWWLRSTVKAGGIQKAQGVTGNGSLDRGGQAEDGNRRAVRPAIWVKMNP